HRAQQIGALVETFQLVQDYRFGEFQRAVFGAAAHGGARHLERLAEFAVLAQRFDGDQVEQWVAFVDRPTRLCQRALQLRLIARPPTGSNQTIGHFAEQRRIGWRLRGFAQKLIEDLFVLRNRFIVPPGLFVRLREFERQIRAHALIGFGDPGLERLDRGGALVRPPLRDGEQPDGARVRRVERDVFTQYFDRFVVAPGANQRG